MSHQFKNVFKGKEGEQHEEPIVIEIPGKPPVVEWNNKQHDIRDIMSKKFEKMIFHKSIGCQTDEIVEEIVETICGCNTCCFANRQNDPEYFAELDGDCDKCICKEIKKPPVNY